MQRRKFIQLSGLSAAAIGVLPALGGTGGFWDLAVPSDLPRATPESQGVSSQAIRQFISAANDSGISWHSFMLVRHGHVVAEGWWDPYKPEFVHSLYSLSKSFTSTAIGLLVKEGKLDIHTKVASFFPRDLPANPSDNFLQMTVRHLLTMNSGHGEDTMPKMRASSDSWVHTYLSLPVEFAPGSHFLYNTGNTYMLGAIVHQVTGQTLEQYLTPRLFQPLGMKGYDWETSPQGLNTAGYGLRVKTEDIAKLGQLYLQKGRWKNNSILMESWVDEATSYQTSSQVNNGDWSQGYGYQFWRCTHDFYRGDGAFGQFCIVMPKLDAVMAVTGQSPDMQQSMNIIWDTIPGGMQSGVLPRDPAQEEALKNVLAELSLPVPKGSMVSSLSSGYGGKRWMVEANDLSVQSLQFDFSSSGGRLSVWKAGKETRLDFGWQKWVVNDARELYVFGARDMFPPDPSRIAGSAVWTDEHTLTVQLRMVEAIFGDRITCVFEGDHVKVQFLNSVAATAKKKVEDPRKELVGHL